MTRRPFVRPIGIALVAAVQLVGHAAGATALHGTNSEREHDHRSPAVDGPTAELVAGHPGLFDGDFDGASEDWLSALEADPRSPLAHATVQALFDLRGLRSRPLDLERVRALRDRVTDGRARSALAALEDELVMRRAFSDAPVERRGRDDLDEIEHWFLLGPHGPLDRYEPLWGVPPTDGPARRWSLRHDSSFGTTLEWSPAKARGGWLAVEDRVQPPVGGELFIAAWIEAELDEGLIELTADFPLEVYWNGELVLREPRRGLTDDPARHLLPVRFSDSGPDALVIRCDNGYSDDVRARVLNADGTVFDGDVMSVADVDDAPTDFPNYIEASPQGRSALVTGDGPFDGPLTMFVHRREGDQDEALAIAEPTDQAALPAWLYQRYFALTSCVHLPDEVQRRALLEIEGRLDALDLDVPEIALWRAHRLLEEDRIGEALELARQLVATHPGVPAFVELERDALAAIDPTGVLGLVAARNGARSGDPDALARLAEWAIARDDLGGAITHLERAATLDGRTGAGHSSALLELLMSGDDASIRRALEWIERWRRADPTATWLDGYVARAEYRLGDEEALVEHLRRRVDEVPTSPQRWVALGDLLLELDRRDSARDAYLRAVELGAPRAGLRLALDELGVADPSEAFFEAFALDTSAAIDAARALDSTAPTALAFDLRMDWIRPDGSVRSRTHIVNLARDRTGTELLHERPVEGTPRVMRVLKSDGSVTEPVAVDGTWVMPDLDPGDVIEAVYDSEQGGTLGVAPALARWRFEDFVQPYVHSRVVTFVPHGAAGRMEVHHFDGTYEQVPWEGGTVHVWEQRDSPQLVDEPGRPDDMALIAWAEYGDDVVLEHVAEEERRSAAHASHVTADVEVELRALARRVAGAPGLTSGERAAALYDAVTEHVLDFSGAGDTTDVWTLRRGRPIGLFAALLGLAGVPYEWALLHPTVPAHLASSAPDPFVSYGDFGDWLLRLAPDTESGEPTWIVMPEGARGLPMGRLPAFLRGGQVLVLGAESSRLEALPDDPHPPGSRTHLTLRLGDDRSATVEGSFLMRDLQGPATRESLSQLEPQQRQQAASQIASQVVPGIDLDDWEFVDLDVHGADFELRFSGTVARFVRGTTRRPYCTPVAAPIRLSRALGSTDRRWPFELLTSQSESLLIEIHGSSTHAIAAEARRVTVAREGLVFDVHWRPGEHATGHGSVTIERSFALDGLRVDPEDMAALLEELVEIEELDSDRLDLVTGDG